MARKLKILFASPEVFPYAKTGGLGDISGSLPLALHDRGHDVRVIMPKYKCVAESRLSFHPTGADIRIPVAGRRQTGFLFQGKLRDKVPLYLVGNDTYYDRDHLYGDRKGDYPDNARRFIFFCRAILETCKALGFHPDILHCNDWQTGLVPIYLKTLYSKDRWFESTRTVFSIHNLGYQGNFPPSALKDAGLPDKLFTPDGVEFFDRFSFLKSGLMYADLLTTVSRTYSREIQTPKFGFGMDGVLRYRSDRLYGILNGVDYKEWNPEVDPWIEKNYGLENLKGKRACKKSLVRRFSLPDNGKSPILSMITRLSSQKGIDLLMGAMEPLLGAGAAFIILGSGDSLYEHFFLDMSKRFPGQCATVIGFDEPLAHQILAGSDILLMPSQYEPCGLTQMYALKYGTAPVVRAVGGLHDSIKTFNHTTRKGTGFKFKHFEINHLLKTVQKALFIYKNKPCWHRLMLNGMEADYSWDRAAGKYTRLYFKVLRGDPSC
ncbi:MAG: glycogen synthase GlgA [Nitrospinaceae bacterium]